MVDHLITEIQRYSLQDGPGIRTTIFIKGCPLHCPWCHNPETQNPKKEFYFYANKCTCCGKCVDVCPTGASTIELSNDNVPSMKIDRQKCISCMKCVDVCPTNARTIVGTEMSIDKIVEAAVADKLFYKNSGGGVTISGGEPLLFPDFTLELAKRLKAEDVHVAIETSCFQRFDKIKPLLPYTDLFLVDIKTLDPKKYKEVIGVSLDIVLSNIESLLASKANVRIHLPIVPGFNDSEEDFKAYIEWLGKHKDRLNGVDLLAYHVYGENKYTLLGRGDTYAYKGVEEMPTDKVKPLGIGLLKAGLKSVTIGGLIGTGDTKE